MDKSHLEFILKEGEGLNIEFKEGISGIDKDMVAFANAEGGRIILGIGDNCTVKGFPLSNRLKSEILSHARNCDPPIEVEVISYGKLTIIEVKESLEKPHKCSEGFFLRQGSTSQKLNVNEIRKLFNSLGKIMFEEIERKDFTNKDFDNSRFMDFLDKTKISRTLSDEELQKSLELKTEKGIFKNIAILLFAKKPSYFLPHNMITCVLYKGNDKVLIIDRKDFNSDVITNYNEAMAFLYKHLRLRYEIKGIGPRKEILEIPPEALKEALINAICHRDYSEKGAVIQIDIFDDRVDISNPGGLIFKESEFGTRSLSRNPLLFSLLQRNDLVEHVGSGIKRIKKAVMEARLEEPVFQFGMFFSVVFKRPDWTSSSVPKEIREKTREKTREKIIELIKNNHYITIKELAEKTGISDKGIEWNMERLKENGLLRRIGPDKGGHWEVVK